MGAKGLLDQPFVVGSQTGNQTNLLVCLRIVLNSPFQRKGTKNLETSLVSVSELGPLLFTRCGCQGNLSICSLLPLI